MTKTHIVHVFSTFDAGGPQVRTAELIRRLPEGYEHSILAMDGRYGCRERVPTDRVRSWLTLDELSGRGLKATRLARYLLAQKPDVVASYNWGAIETALGLRWRGFGGVLHHEDGFGPDERARQKRRRVLARRYALARAARVIVCSHGLERIARDIWKLDESLVQLIPNGIDLTRFEADPEGARRAQAKAKFGLPESSLVIGSVGHLRPEKNFMRLAESFAAIAEAHPEARLLLVGDGVERASIEAFLEERGLSARAHLAGSMSDPRDAYDAFDVFAITSDTEQMPISLLEATAVGRAVISTDVGDVAPMLAPENRRFVTEAGQLRQSLESLLASAELRRKLAHANHARCRAEFPVEVCVERYRAQYDRAARLSRGEP